MTPVPMKKRRLSPVPGGFIHVSRRDAIKTVAAAGLAASLSGCATFSEARRNLVIVQRGVVPPAFEISDGFTTPQRRTKAPPAGR